MLSRITSIFLGCSLISCSSYLRAELKALVPNIDLGMISTDKGLMPLSWTITNSDSSELRLIRINTVYPNTKVALETGILAPGASTKVIATFDPKNTIGPVQGILEIVAEYGPIVTLTFQGEIRCDIEPRTELKIIINEISSKAAAINGKPLIFTTKSGTFFVPSRISISSENFIGAHMAVNNDRLELIPYIYEPSLPNCQSGNTVLKVCFRHDIGSLTYNVPITWERKDPLRVINMGSGAYAVSYDDNRPFQVLSLIVPSGLAYTTQFSDDGCMLFLKPLEKVAIHQSGLKVAKSPKPGVVGKKQRLAAKVKPRQSHSLLNAKISPKAKLNVKRSHDTSIKQQNKLNTGSNIISHDTKVLIQLDTTHPYRSEVVISK